MASSAISSDYMRGSLDPIILRVLLEGDSYGYEIIKAVSHNSGGVYELKEPSLYTSLKRLEALACVTSYWGKRKPGWPAKVLPDHAKGPSIIRNILGPMETGAGLD